MLSGQQMMLESMTMAVLNVLAVYLAAFSYRLTWYGVMGTMIGMSLITALVTHITTAKKTTGDEPSHITVMLFAEGFATLVIAALSALAVLLILSFRFNFPMALGIAMLSGFLSAFFRSILRGL
jgi:hypothetical protein